MIFDNSAAVRVASNLDARCTVGEARRAKSGRRAISGRVRQGEHEPAKLSVSEDS